MDESWLNPDFAINNIVTLVGAILLILIVLPAVFGLLIYGVLTLIARLRDLQHAARTGPDADDR